MARKVHDHISEKMELGVFSDSSLSNEERLSLLREEAKKFVSDLLDEPNKKRLSESDIRLRLNGFLKHELDRTAHSPELMPELEYVHPDGRVEARPLSHVFERIAQKQSHESNTGENIEQWFDANLVELVQLGVFDRPEITHENALVLARSYQRTKATLNSVLAARHRGDYVYEQAFYAADGIQYPSTGDHTSAHKVSEMQTVQSGYLIKLSDLIDKFCKSQIADGVWRPHTLSDHRNRLVNIVDILGDMNAAQVTRSQMRHVRDTLKKLPPSRKKKSIYKDKTVEEILQMDYNKTLSVKTVNDSIEAISSMFSWAIREQLLSDNPATGLKLRDDNPDIDKKDSFTLDDLKKIFFTDDYKPSYFSDPAYYWCPLIALYTGMRLEEICQLQCRDVYEDEYNIYIFDINTNSDNGEVVKKLKTKSAIRKVPIHPYLISKGLLEYLKKIRDSKEIRLFPNLNITPKSPKYGKQVGKNFSELLKCKGIEGKKSFHSLRHTFAQFFKEAGLHDEVFRQVFGHQQTELASKTYGSRFSSKICYERLISKLTYSPEDNVASTPKKYK